MKAFALEWLDHGHLRNVDVTATDRKKLRVLREGRRPIHALVVDADFFDGMHVIELDHLLRSHDGQAALFARVEP